MSVYKYIGITHVPIEFLKAPKFRKNPGNDNTRYMGSCITILLINAPYFISVVSIVLVMWVLPDQISFHEIIFAWIPMLTSALNPLIVLTRTTDARNATLRLLRGWTGRGYATEHSQSNTQSNRQSNTQSNTQSTQASRGGGSSRLPPAGSFTVIANKSASAV
jgi:hypothetical protein